MQSSKYRRGKKLNTPQESNSIVSRAVESVINKNKDKNRKVYFEENPGTFREPGIEESDSETKLYGIKILNIVELEYGWADDYIK